MSRGFVASMKFSTRHLLYLTTLIAAYFTLRSWWVSTAIPTSGGLIPLALAAAVAMYFGWTRRSVLAAGLWAGATAMLSASAIAAEVIFGSNATSFLRPDGSEKDYHADLTLNVIAISIITIACLIGGAILAFVLRLFHSRLTRWREERRAEHLPASVTSRSYWRSPWLAAAVAGLSIVVLCLLFSSRPKVTDTTVKRVRPGMLRQEVEAILGQPNPLADLKRKGEAFWDGHTHLGRRYVKVHVRYDQDGRVDQVVADGFWRGRQWLFW